MSTRLNAVMQVMRGKQIQASGLDHLAGWPPSHVAVVTKRLRAGGLQKRSSASGPNHDVAINISMCVGSEPSLPERMPGAQGRGVRNVAGLHRGVAPTDFDREWGRFPGSNGSSRWNVKAGVWFS